jgi:2',3'-cyclic-nucleotide 2'-phosphodiesterase / 3'-nucleotidase
MVKGVFEAPVIRFLLLLFALALNAQDVQIQVLATTDLHGHVLARDTYTLQPANQGWAKLATLIRKQKALNPATILVDSGDVISGEPINYVRNRLKPELPEPDLAIMNALGYNVMAIGNHEFDYGFPLLRSVEEQAKFPFLSANIVFTATGKSVFTPYVMVEVSGVKVAILGLTMAAVPASTDPANVEGLKFLDPVETARNLVPKLRDSEKADLVLVVIHGGLAKGPCSSWSGAPVQCLVDKVPGIDLILAGHTHEALVTRVSGVPLIQAQSYGRALGVAEFTLRKSRARWVVAKFESRLEKPNSETPEDPQVLELTAPLRAATETYLNTSAVDLSSDLDSRWCRMEDTPVIQLLHTVLRRATGAQLSAIGCPSSRIFIPRGPTAVRQFYALVPYEDRIARIVITGAQLKKYLEHAARAFNYSHQPELFNPEVRAQDFDLVSGVTYILDLSKLPGSRVTDLKFQGSPVRTEQTFSLAITTYRLAGGGGYLDAIGFKGQPELITSLTLRNLLLEYVLSRPSLSVPLANNWRTIPALDRERVLAQAP